MKFLIVIQGILCYTKWNSQIFPGFGFVPIDYPEHRECG